MPSLFSVFKQSGRSMINNPLLFIPPIISIIFLTLLSMLSVKVNYLIGNDNSAVIILWNIIIFSLIFLSILSYFSSGLIFMFFSSIRSRAKVRDFFTGTKKYWLRTFVIMLIIFAVGTWGPVLCSYLFSKLIILMGIKMSAFLFRFFLFLIAILWILLTVTFLTFANFFLIYDDLSIMKSIKRSAIFVANKYPYVLAIMLIFYIIWRLASYLNFVILGLSLSELVLNVIVYPYLIIVLATFLYHNVSKK